MIFLQSFSESCFQKHLIAFCLKLNFKTKDQVCFYEDCFLLNSKIKIKIVFHFSFPFTDQGLHQVRGRPQVVLVGGHQRFLRGQGVLRVVPQGDRQGCLLLAQQTRLQLVPRSRRKDLRRSFRRRFEEEHRGWDQQGIREYHFLTRHFPESKFNPDPFSDLSDTTIWVTVMQIIQMFTKFLRSNFLNFDFFGKHS